MTLVDELLTPGCPNCAVKHLSAALAMLAEDPLADFSHHLDDPGHILCARADINVVEAIEGYRSHYDFAVGLLVQAEQDLCCVGNIYGAACARERRLALMEAGSDPARLAKTLSGRGVFSPGIRFLAHLDEAAREMPADQKFRDLVDKARNAACLPGPGRAAGLVEAIRYVREHYFEVKPTGKEVKDNGVQEETGRVQGRQDQEGGV